MKFHPPIRPLVARKGNVWYHLLAFAIVSIWGTTFVSTKILLLSGLTPSDIMLYRFFLAYCGICLCSRPFKLFADTWREECLCVLAGLFGGTLYFITENTALKYTLVSNVALICSITPLLILLIQSFIIRREKPVRKLWIGSVLSFLGVGAVIFNGRFVFNLSPVGDLLCLVSSLSWTLYTFVTRHLSKHYTPLFIVRKTFFYGMITLLPWLLTEGAFTFDVSLLGESRVWSQLLFLGLIASFLCFLLWNVCLRKLDTVVLSNYIYVGPVISILTSHFILGEDINAVLVGGALCVLLGMYWAGRR